VKTEQSVVRGWRAFINRGFVSLIMKSQPPFFTAQMARLPRRGDAALPTSLNAAGDV